MPSKVWVLDDNRAVAESTTALLLAEGIDARSQSSVDTTLAELRRGTLPSVLITDLRMVGNGHTLLTEILAEPGWTFPVVVLSGYPEEVPTALAGRVFAVLTKPGKPLDLVETVRRAQGERP